MGVAFPLYTSRWSGFWVGVGKSTEASLMGEGGASDGREGVAAADHALGVHRAGSTWYPPHFITTPAASTLILEGRQEPLRARRPYRLGLSTGLRDRSAQPHGRPSTGGRAPSSSCGLVGHSPPTPGDHLHVGAACPSPRAQEIGQFKNIRHTETKSCQIYSLK